METKKWSTKKKVLVSILVILCAAIIAGVLYMFFKPDPLPAGAYELRLLRDDAYGVEALARFTVR